MIKPRTKINTKIDACLLYCLLDCYLVCLLSHKNKAGYTAISCGRVGRGRNARFPTFQLDHHGPTDRPTDRWTDGRTDGRMDKASYRVACPQLKSENDRFILRQSMCSMSLVLLIHTISILLRFSEINRKILTHGNARIFSHVLCDFYHALLAPKLYDLVAPHLLKCLTHSCPCQTGTEVLMYRAKWHTFYLVLTTFHLLLTTYYL